MNDAAKAENARTLAALLQIDDGDAAKLLDLKVAITVDVNDKPHVDLAAQVRELVCRTIGFVSADNECGLSPHVELILGAAQPRFNCSSVFGTICEESVLISRLPVHTSTGRTHPIGILLGACYASGAVLKAALKDAIFFASPDILKVNLSELVGNDLPKLYETIAFNETHLAGAGAIGNGFIHGLSCFDVSGTLQVVDDDNVTEGNLQRCVLFTQEDVLHPKAKQLCTAIHRVLPNVSAFPQCTRLQDVPNKFPGPWLKRLVVAVDSPRARRSLQAEIPGEVFDASTTGITEIVLHCHKQVTTDACMACIYPHTAQEHAHEKHVAETLGISLSEVLDERVNAETAARICERYPQLIPSSLIGTAYDTLFKQLCATQRLHTAEDQRVLAPFAFVSVLAGAFLALEFVRRTHCGHERLFNEWRLSPWTNPVLRRRRILAKNPECEFCGNPTLAAVTNQLWGDGFAQAGPISSSAKR